MLAEIRRSGGCLRSPFAISEILGFMIIMLAMTPLMAALIYGRGQRLTIAIVLLFGVAGALIVYAGIKAWNSIQFRYGVLPRLNKGWRPHKARLECEFEFPAGGTVVRARDVAQFTSSLGENPMEQVIFLPSDPQHARFIRALPLEMQVELGA